MNEDRNEHSEDYCGNAKDVTMSCEKVYVLQGIVNKVTYESRVLGAYESFEVMQNALDMFHKSTQLSHYFYDIKLSDCSASWTNDQQMIRPT